VADDDKRSTAGVEIAHQHSSVSDRDGGRLVDSRISATAQPCASDTRRACRGQMHRVLLAVRPSSSINAANIGIAVGLSPGSTWPAWWRGSEVAAQLAHHGAGLPKTGRGPADIWRRTWQRRFPNVAPTSDTRSARRNDSPRGHSGVPPKVKAISLSCMKRRSHNAYMWPAQFATARICVSVTG